MLNKNNDKQSNNDIFSHIKTGFLDYDPAYFVQNNLTLDGDPFSIIGNGWRFLVDIYRYIALEATKKDGKPVVICKGRQVGATMMAGGMDLYFTNSGLFSNPPIRVAHLFPSLNIMQRFSQDKLEGLIRTAKGDFVNKNKLKSDNAAYNLTMRQFNSGTLWVESMGADGDRLRGMTCDAVFFDECFPYQTFVEVDGGKIKIGKLYDMFKRGEPLPKVKTYNEFSDTFEYREITNAWNRGKRHTIKILAGNKAITCTPEHKFLTSDGWCEAKNLKIGTLLKASPYTKSKIRSLNDDQLQIVLGSFLGDGHIRDEKNGRRRLSIVHGIKQEEYCNWKASMFQSKTTTFKNNGFSKKDAIKFVTGVFAINEKFPNSKTHCPQWILDKLDYRGLAIWIMDDGSAKKWSNGNSGNMCISTNSFDEDSQKRIVQKLKDLGIDSQYKSFDGYYSIYINKESYEFMSKMCGPFFHKSMEYKILNKYSACDYGWNYKFNNHTYCVVDGIVDNKEMNVYDISVEENHNFIVCPSAHSKNLGGPIVHNCQDMPALAVNNTTKILTASKYGQIGKGVQVYFGTPKEKDSFFYNIWNQSSKRYYHLGCKGCNKTFPFYQTNSDSWKDIWIKGYIIKCPLCGLEQHKIDAIERGKWETSVDEDQKYTGFHINQLYIPTLTREYINDLMPENNQNQTERTWNNEVIGEFYSGLGMPLTRSTIELMCRDKDRAFSRSINPKDRRTYLGMDWGDKADKDQTGQSWSCAVVLSDVGNGVLQIEHAHKLSERTFNYKKETINEMYRRFGIKQGISDFFFGQDVVRDAQAVYGDRFLGAQGSSNLLNPIKYREDELMITYNKDLLIDEIFEKIKKGNIRFPWKSYEYIEWLIDHCTSMSLSIRMQSGQQVKTYMKGGTPNDGLMALMYAYIAWKFDVTEKFTKKPGKKEEARLPKPALAYAPKLRK